MGALIGIRYCCLRVDKVSSNSRDCISNSRLVLTRSLTDSTSFAPKAVRDFVATIDGCLCFMSSPKNADTLSSFSRNSLMRLAIFVRHPLREVFNPYLGSLVLYWIYLVLLHRKRSYFFMLQRNNFNNAFFTIGKDFF